MSMNPDVPLHYQIYQQMRAEIEDGLWTGRDDFPGEEDLAQRFGVSVITTRKALTRLAEEHELRYRQLVRFYQLEPEGRIKSFVYANADDAPTP